MLTRLCYLSMDFIFKGTKYEEKYIILQIIRIIKRFSLKKKKIIQRFKNKLIHKKIKITILSVNNKI